MDFPIEVYSSKFDRSYEEDMLRRYAALQGSNANATPSNGVPHRYLKLRKKATDPFWPEIVKAVETGERWIQLKQELEKVEGLIAQAAEEAKAPKEENKEEEQPEGEGEAQPTE